MSYDFVVIGSGPAGATLSWKLAKSGFKIALIDRAIQEEKKLVNDFFVHILIKYQNFILLFIVISLVEIVLYGMEKFI